jgi:hypothetical protein
VLFKQGKDLLPIRRVIRNLVDEYRISQRCGKFNCMWKKVGMFIFTVLVLGNRENKKEKEYLQEQPS